MKQPKSEFRTAFIDIETAPNLGYIWGKWEQNVLEFESEWYILSFSIKWQGDRKPTTYALPDFPLYKKEPENDRQLVKKLWDIFNEADLIVAHNGDNFDCKKSNARFIFHGLTPPAPYKTVDTLRVARRHFNFTSNKLDDIVKYLGIGQKVKTGGYDLWSRCLKGDTAAWALMKKYNEHDVILLEKVYDRFRGWHTTHPNVNLKDNPHEGKCPACGSLNVQRRGWEYIRAMRARRYACQDCGKWSKGKRERIPGVLLQ